MCACVRKNMNLINLRVCLWFIVIRALCVFIRLSFMQKYFAVEMICAGIRCCCSIIPSHAYFKQKLELLYWDQKRHTRTYGYHARASHSITAVSHQHAISFHRVSISQSFSWDYRTHCFWLEPYFIHSGLILYWCQSTFPQSLSSLLPLDLSLLAESALSFRFASRLCLTFGMGDLFAAFLGTITPDPSQAPFFF